MPDLRIHIVHVGSTRNKGTQALLKSDVSTIRDVLGSDVIMSVSAVDPEEVRLLFPSLDEVVCPMVDIPHDKADVIARRSGYGRDCLRYKLVVAANLIWMPVQIALCVLSSLLAKARLKPLYRSEVLDQIRKSQLVVSCSDENFKEGASLLRLNFFWILAWWSMIMSRLFDILVSKYFGKRVVMFPNSIGPFRTFIGRSLARLALQNCSHLLIRDPVSYKTVESLNMTPPRILTFDMALLFGSSEIEVHCETSIAGTGKRMVGVSLGFYGYVVSEKKMRRMIVEYASVLDKMVDELDSYVVFLPHYVSDFRFDDLEVCQLILDNMNNKDKASILSVRSVGELLSVLEKADMVITSKMHPAVLATSHYVPTVCIAYDLKQIGYFRQLGMADCILSVNESPLKLQNKIEYVWSNRARIRASLKEKIPIMQANVRHAVEQALKLAK